MSIRGLSIAFFFCSACSVDPYKGTDTDIPPPKGQEDTSCGESSPEVYDITISNNGIQQFGEGSQVAEWPSILIEVSADDVDGDMTSFILDIWYDTNPDGVVSTGATNLVSRVDTVGGEDCSVQAVTGSSILAITGNPPMDQLVEFGAIITDMAGNESNEGVPFTQTFHTPDASGNVP
jgi:hypothetical protein